MIYESPTTLLLLANAALSSAQRRESYWSSASLVARVKREAKRETLGTESRTLKNGFSGFSSCWVLSLEVVLKCTAWWVFVYLRFEVEFGFCKLQKKVSDACAEFELSSCRF